jgi:hypothetical protein
MNYAIEHLVGLLSSNTLPAVLLGQPISLIASSINPVALVASTINVGTWTPYKA